MKNSITLITLRLVTLMFIAGICKSAIADSIKGNPEAGKAKAGICIACHGSDGNSMAPTFPKIAGQGEKYLYKQLLDIKSNVRPVPMMAPMLRGKTKQDLADLAAFYAIQTVKPGQAKKDLVTLGEKIYRGGNLTSGLTACIACHGPKGMGIPSAAYPALSGQHATYTKSQLEAFRSAGRNDSSGAKRSNDGESAMMRSVAAKMSDAEIKAVSSYIEGLR